MGWIVKTGALLGAVLAASGMEAPVSAQAGPDETALDRVDPNQAEEEREQETRQQPPASVTVSSETAAPLALSEGTYDVGPILIEGMVALAPTDFADIIEDYSARRLTDEQLAELSRLVAERARERGYLFATAWIAPQALELNLLRIRVDEGAIDEIRLEGPQDRAVQAMLAPLADGTPVHKRKLERQVLLADDISGVRISRSRFEREGARGILVIELSRESASGYAELDNDGSAPVGPVQARIDADFNGLISPFDEVDLSYSTTPLDPEELQYVRGRYGVVINSAGTELSAYASYAQTRPGSFLADRDIFGESTRFGMKITHPMLRSRNASVWAHLALELANLRQDRRGITVRHDRVPVARFGLYSRAALLGGTLRGELELSQGIAGLGATPEGDSLASRLDAEPDFTTIAAWARWNGPLLDNIDLALAARGQISTAPLLISEDLGLGGNSFLRGYDFSERTGDEGIMGYGELRYNWRDAMGIFRRMQFYAYADGGVVGNLEDGFGGGSLASGGGGIRTDITRNIDLDFEVAVPLTGPRFDTDDSSPRLNVSVGTSF